jgi:hypothetical protein
LITLNHTPQSVGLLWTRDWPVADRDLYLTTQTLYKTNIHAPGGIWTHDPSKRAAADLRLRPRGQWDRDTFIKKNIKHSQQHTFKMDILITACKLYNKSTQYSFHFAHYEKSIAPHFDLSNIMCSAEVMKRIVLSRETSTRPLGTSARQHIPPHKQRHFEADATAVSG